MTKRYKRLYATFKFLSILFGLAPLCYAVVTSFGSSAASTTDKVSLSVCIIAAALIYLVNLVFKYHIKSALWFIVLGVHTCIGNIGDILLITGICCIVDEFVLTPVYKHYKEKYSINKEIDKRLP